MLWYLPKERQLGIHLGHKPSDGKMCCCSGTIATYLHMLVGRIWCIYRYRRYMSLLCQTIALKMDMQQCCQEKCGEKRIDPFLMFGYDKDTVHRPFQGAKYQLNLPTVGVEQNNLKCRDIGSIRH